MARGRGPRALFKRKADNLAAAGVDLIMMEMMRDQDYSVWATEAAQATGLPVWIGVSVERHDGKLTGFGREDQDFEAVARALSALNPDVISIMHSSPNDTDEAIDVLRRHWNGPIGAYPESGYFKMPDWTFVTSSARRTGGTLESLEDEGRERLRRLLRSGDRITSLHCAGVQAVKTGSCLCGAVSFEVRGDLRPVLACHCIQCRKQTGQLYVGHRCA